MKSNKAVLFGILTGFAALVLIAWIAGIFPDTPIIITFFSISFSSWFLLMQTEKGKKPCKTTTSLEKSRKTYDIH